VEGRRGGRREGEGREKWKMEEKGEGMIRERRGEGREKGRRKKQKEEGRRVRERCQNEEGRLT
jgi:hypothetical protein